MFDLGVLDTAIAMVVVILLLSLMVQSIQTFIKKLTKFKSRQIAKSIEKLFEQVPATPAPGGKAKTAAQMKKEVLDKFAKLGRDSLFGGHALESLAKADLSKIVAAVQAADLIPTNVQGSLTTFFTKIQQVQTAIKTLSTIELSSEAQAKLAELRTLLMPLATSLEPLFAGGAFNGKAVARDVFALRNLDTTMIVTIAHEFEADIHAAATASPGNTGLTTAATTASALATHVREASVAVTEFVTRLNGQIGALESWFDTVMQGFEERYSRHMRTWTFFISLAVAVVMDANVIQLWNRLEADPQLAIAKAELIQKRYAEASAKPASTSSQTAENEPAPTSDATVSTTTGGNSQAAPAKPGNDADQKSETSDADSEALQKELKKLETEFNEAFADANALGLKVLDPAVWWKGSFADKVKSIVGWSIMAFLLGLGAPFWHDTLESLFGLKNLLRQRGKVSNVEQSSGAGMTKS